MLKFKLISRTFSTITTLVLLHCPPTGAPFHQLLCVVLILTRGEGWRTESERQGGERERERQGEKEKHRHEMEMRKAHAPTQVGREASRKGLR